MSHRLQEETAKVEEHLLDDKDGQPSFVVAIIRCVTISKTNAVENLLEPLQKLLRLSPPIAATLARPDMFERLGQKLHHTKPAVRVNLLRILSTICDSCDERCGLLRRYGILDSIRELQNDSRVLVRELASQLVKSGEETQPLNGARARRPTLRRTSVTATPPSLIASHSMPSTPQINRSGASSKPSSYLDSRDSPRRQNGSNSGSLALRPGSRDGRSPALGHSASAAAAAAAAQVQGGGAMKPPPRLAHRLSQQVKPPLTPDKEDVRPSTPLVERRRRPTDSGSEWPSER